MARLEAKSAEDRLLLDYFNAHADEELKASVEAGGKTLEGAWDYISQEARKAAVDNRAVVRDETVFGWGMDYFRKEEKKNEKVKKAKAVKNEERVREDVGEQGGDVVNLIGGMTC